MIPRSSSCVNLPEIYADLLNLKRDYRVHIMHIRNSVYASEIYPDIRMKIWVENSDGSIGFELIYIKHNTSYITREQRNEYGRYEEFEVPQNVIYSDIHLILEPDNSVCQVLDEFYDNWYYQARTLIIEDLIREFPESMKSEDKFKTEWARIYADLFCTLYHNQYKIWN
jgi:hypothetical protein